ncbi:hypothetical protein ACFO25_05215 [Paenactinomyces guangxiensis]|uniref:Uncharacterized protein n=1 Tax=Paenactinomyces guangxiensis TaxID=1490290 RepID=A0A7W1WPR2_9BACL|nr:hypothetical protein [Paenactinomyces guangxiensis]MBA4493777.1 hypothetical protein [Paenactinomyces guangxiensis]MBH8591066.1 hypothetical protein [Paenactinomyces guangxiensis]
MEEEAIREFFEVLGEDVESIAPQVKERARQFLRKSGIIEQKMLKTIADHYAQKSLGAEGPSPKENGSSNLNEDNKEIKISIADSENGIKPDQTPETTKKSRNKPILGFIFSSIMLIFSIIFNYTINEKLWPLVALCLMIALGFLAYHYLSSDKDDTGMDV